jgi:hypothetical protein
MKCFSLFCFILANLILFQVVHTKNSKFMKKINKFDPLSMIVESKTGVNISAISNTVNNFDPFQNQNQNQTNNGGSNNDLPEPSVYKGNCFVKINNMFFDLNPLSSGCRYIYIYNFNYNLFFFRNYFINPNPNPNPNSNSSSSNSNNTNKAHFELNFCRNVETDCNNTEGLLVDRTNCKVFAKNTEKIFELLNIQSKLKRVNSIINSTNSSQVVAQSSVLRISLGEGDVCGQAQGKVQKYKTYLEIQCDEQEKFARIENFNDFSPDKCENTLILKSKYGCPVGSYRPWYEMFPVDKQIVAIGLIIIGVFLMIFGEKFYTANVMVIVGLFAGIILYNMFGKTMSLHWSSKNKYYIYIYFYY